MNKYDHLQLCTIRKGHEHSEHNVVHHSEVRFGLFLIKDVLKKASYGDITSFDVLSIFNHGIFFHRIFNTIGIWTQIH